MTTDGPSLSFDTVVLDLDGTLVDSVYQHVVAWRSAFQAVGMDVPAARIHRAIGMGGDRLVTEVAGRSAEAAVGDEVRAIHDERFESLLPQVTATEGAFELLEALRRADLNVVVASSGEESRHREAADPGRRRARCCTPGSPARMSRSPSRPPTCWTWPWRRSRASARSSSGDAVWDVQTAHERKFPCIGLLTGGISEAELRDAGASAVYATPAELAEDLQAALAALDGR